MNYTIDYSDDYICIKRNDYNMICWDQFEWKENPSIVFSIVHIIELALTKPKEMDKKLLNMGILSEEDLGD